MPQKTLKKGARAEQAERPFKACECYSVYEYDINADPEDDSSEVIGRAYSQCGAQTQSEFRQGHDAKLKSVLLECFRQSLGYYQIRGSMLVDSDPLEIARQRGWEHFMVPGKPKPEPKASTQFKAKDTPKERLALINNMKKAAAKAKSEDLLNATGDRLQVTVDNWQDIVDGKLGTPRSEFKLGVGSKVKINYRAKIYTGMITEVQGERARVAFELANGKPTERVVELISLRS